MDDEPLRPRVTVVDPARPATQVDVLGTDGPHRSSRATRAVVGLVLLALLVEGGVSASSRLRLADRQRSTRAAAEAADQEAGSLHLSLLSWSAASHSTSDAPAVDGPVRDALVRLVVLNGGGAPVRLVAGRLDGAPPAARVDRQAVPAGGTALVTARWRVLCAEVGTLPGPHVLELRAAPVGGHEYVVRLDLRPGSLDSGGSSGRDGTETDEGGPAPAFRQAAVLACGTALA